MNANVGESFDEAFQRVRDGRFATRAASRFRRTPRGRGDPTLPRRWIGWSSGFNATAPAARRRRRASRCRRSSCPTTPDTWSASISFSPKVRSPSPFIAGIGVPIAASTSMHWRKRTKTSRPKAVRSSPSCPTGGNSSPSSRSQSNVPFPILTDMDNGYALSFNLTIWVGAEMQTMMEGRHDLPTFQGNDLLDASDPGDLRRQARRCIKAAVHRSRLSQAHGNSSMLTALSS